MNSILPEKSNSSQSQLIIYQSSNGPVELQPDLEHHTIWATQKQIASSLELSVQAVSSQIANWKKQRGNQGIKQVLITASDGKQYNVEHYNMTVITFVGFRAQATDAVLKFQDKVGEALDAIMSGRTTAVIASDPISQLKLLLSALEQQQADIQALKLADEKRQAELQALGERVDHTEYLTVKQYCVLQRISHTPAIVQEWGRNAAKLSRAMEVRIIEVPTQGERYPTVKTYHVSILEKVCVAKQKPLPPDQLRLIGDGK